MVDVGKREDRLLDALSVYRQNRDSTRAWLDIFLEANMIDAEVASVLWEALTGLKGAPDEQPVEA